MVVIGYNIVTSISWAPDVFSHGIWPEMSHIEDPELIDLAEALPAIALRSKAPATVRKYAGGFSRWKKWAASKPGIEAFPAKPFQFALYLAFLTQTAKTGVPVEEAVNSIS